MMIAACMESLDYEDFERLCERHQLPFEETDLEDDIRESFRQYVSKLADAELSRFLMELALLPSGYSSNQLQEDNRLLAAARLYKQSGKEWKKPAARTIPKTKLATRRKVARS
ncbi:MAG: hypothetical protein JWN34_4487 [Bryobacterales bacterium]|nr:hypothetical protein [Bryobacterales bacterium]